MSKRKITTKPRELPVKLSSAKRTELNKVINSVHMSGLSSRNLEKYAASIVDPGNAEPVLFPSPVPGRAGVARFPLVVEVSDMSDFAIRVSPELHNPLMISHSTGIPETTSPVGGDFSCSKSRVVSLADEMEAIRGCVISMESVAGRRCLPLSSVAGTTFTVELTLGELTQASRTEFLVYNGFTWVPLWTSMSWDTGKTTNSVPLTYLTTYTHFTFSMIAPSQGGVDSLGYGSLDNTFTLRPTVGTWTCAAAPAENIFDTFKPEWDALQSASEWMRIVAMDCLVTYQGSTLNNQGGIAVCNASENLPMANNYYDTIARRPFDMYEGRLASEGSTEGGAHWHYVPSSLDYLSPTPDTADTPTDMCGWVAIKGMDSSQPVRIIVHIVVNYFSLDPSYQMSYQPSYAGFSDLIHILRHQVPLVSSNDSHLKKLLKLAKSGAGKATKLAIDNPEMILKALTMLASML